MASKNTKSSSEALTFEASLAKIEALVEQLEDENSSLEDSLVAFEQGIRLTREAQAALAAAEQKVQLLLEENSEPRVVDFPGDEDS